MKIPKIFGNRIILVVVALALIIVVLISIINVGKIAFTGFAGLDEEPTQENPVLPEELKDKVNETALSITIVPEPLINLPSNENYTNSSSDMPQVTRRSGGHRSGGSSGGSSSSSSNPDNNDNQEEPPLILSKRKLTKKPKNLNLKRDDTEINEGEEFEGIVRFRLEKYNRKISTFDINFSEDADLSDIIADTDFASGKAFLHSRSGRLKNIDLYVPKEEGDIAIVICSNASNYDEIYYGCSNNSHVTREELLPISSSRVEVSSDGLYYIIHGITGTGATGVNVTELNSSHQNATPPGSLDAFAGNVTEINMPNASGITQAWAGYYGNVSGAIQLADSSDKVMYNWSLASPEGQVFASTNSSIGWDNTQCFNFTASGTYSDESGNGGSTNLYGTNLSLLETQYGIQLGDLDGIDETFYLLGANTHNTFHVNSKEFNEGECQNTRIFDSSGWGVDNNFEEVLLYEPTTFSVIFASLLNEDVLGFDQKAHDFEMLVLEDGHQTDKEITIYYFYAVMF